MTTREAVRTELDRAAEDERRRQARTTVWGLVTDEPVVSLPAELTQRQVRAVLEALGCRRPEQCEYEWLMLGVTKFWSTSEAGVEFDPIVVRRIVKGTAG